MKPFNRRTSATSSTAAVALATGGLVVSAVLAGCSSGQIAQTATQEAAVNGTSASAGAIDLRNIHLRADLTSDYVEPGSEVELIFVAANGSPDVPDELMSITSDVGSVTLAGDPEVPVNGVLRVGAPEGSLLEGIEEADTAEATVELSKPITNGLTYDFTFTFENGGETTVAVPVSAGEQPRRDPLPGEGGSSGPSGGH